jgi:hypothetical protein
VSSKLRPETTTATTRALPDDTALFLIRDAVAKRRILIHGRLDDAYGNHCAIGCFWTDNPKLVLRSSLIDEVAAVNDSVPPGPGSAQKRWKKVNAWLRWKLRVLTAKESSRGK